MVTKVITDNSSGGDYAGCECTGIRENTPTTNYGTDTTFESQRYGAGLYFNGLIKFSGLSNIPANATITSVTLGLYLDVNSLTDTGFQDGLYPVLRNWTEAGATWGKYDGSNAWTTAGAIGSGDVAASASCQVVIGTGATGYVNFTDGGLIADVQAIVSGSANYGWLLRKDGGGTNDGSYRAFRSDNGADGTRPTLTVVYTLTAGYERAGNRGVSRGVDRGVN